MSKSLLDTAVDAVLAMREVGFLDRAALENGLSAALQTADHKPSWFEKLRKVFGLHRPYARNLPEQIAEFIRTPDTLTRAEIRAGLEALLSRETVRQTVGRYLRQAGYAEYGFPIRELSAPAFSRVLSGFAYRFAYGEAAAVRSDEMTKAYEYRGCYKMMVRAQGADWTRVHLLFVFDVGHHRIECLEVFPVGDGLTARAGFLVPAHDGITAILSDQYDESMARETLSQFIGDWEASDRRVDLDVEARPSNQMDIVQSRNLAHLELVFTADRLKGRYLTGEEAGRVAGYRLPQDELKADVFQSLREFPKDKASDRLSERELRIFDEMGLFSLKSPKGEAPPPVSP